MTFRVAGAQLNLVVGDIVGNERRIGDAIRQAQSDRVDLLLTPELSVCGYPPEDLVNRSDFVSANRRAVERIAAATGSTAVIVGFVDHAAPGHAGAADGASRQVANAAALLHNGSVVGVYHKVLLPNYGVFDEDRNFSPGVEPGAVWDIGGLRVGISICEDIWVADGPARDQVEAGARLVANINASPFHAGKLAEREQMLSERARQLGVPLVYLNLVGGQDELVFDGASVVFDASGDLQHRSAQFEEGYFHVDLDQGRVTASSPVQPPLDPDEEVYRALVRGLGDYVEKNHFSGVVLGLSGGIDSALTAAIAVDALGADRVWGVAMPSRFSSAHSLEDAQQLATNLGIRFDTVPIDSMFQAFLGGLEALFAETEFGVAEENLQARIRGMILMAISNKFGPMVLSTGNKSEMATGYATLYGDMAGGYAVLKDVFKTLVYRLAEWRNRDGEVIPANTITKPPSAELRPDQVDSDSLPPYPVLDAILGGYIEDDLGFAALVESGFEEGLVSRVIGMVDRSEYKRRQAAPGVKITTRAFGKDRRLPITNAYRSEGK